MSLSPSSTETPLVVDIDDRTKALLFFLHPESQVAEVFSEKPKSQVIEVILENPESDEETIISTREKSSSEGNDSTRSDSVASDDESVANEEGPAMGGCPPSTPAPLPGIPNPQRKESPDIFSNVFFKISCSGIGGYGAIARKAIPKGEIILTEKALIVATDDDLLEAERVLDKESREVIKSLHGFRRYGRDIHYLQAVYDTNKFKVEGEVSGLFPIAARFNHRCTGACNVDWVVRKVESGAVITLTTNRPVRQGEELTISYGAPPDMLWVKYGILCKCGVCQPLTDAEIRELDGGFY